MQTAEKKKYTADDYMALEEGAPFQLIEGELVMSPSPIVRHQQLVLRFALLIETFLISHPTGGSVIISPMDILLDDENILQPDVLYISPERKHIIGDRINGAPDLVIEVLSPSNAYYDLKKKKAIYERFGVKEYLIADPETSDIQQLLLEDELFLAPKTFGLTDKISVMTIPGLSLSVQAVFNQ